jgi:hypothetical protein
LRTFPALSIRTSRSGRSVPSSSAISAWRALGIVGVIRRARGAVGIIALLLFAAHADLLWHYGNIYVIEVEALFVYFAFGAFAYLNRDRIPMAPWIAAVRCATLLAMPTTRAFAYVVVARVAHLTPFAAMRLPLPGFDRRVDV